MTLSAQAPLSSIQGKAITSDNTPVGFATVTLFNELDSTQFKSIMTEENGEFLFKNVPEGIYYLMIRLTESSYLNTESFSLGANENRNLGIFTLNEKNYDLKDVIIEGLRDYRKIITGGIEYPIKNIPYVAGTNVKDLFDLLPDIMIDPNNDRIMVRGQSNVQVYLNGKPSPLSGQDLFNMLKTLQSNQVESVKVLTSPGPEYPAEGNIIIDIVLSKNVKLGSNTSVNLGFAYGRYGKYDGSFTTNYRNSAFNAFGSYGLGTGQNWGFIRGVRSQLATDFNFDIQTLTYNQNHNFRGGIDWFLGSKQTIGIQVNGILGNTDKVTDTYSENIIRETGLVRDILVSQNQNDEEKNQINLNLNYQFRGTDGSGLNLDVDYGKFDFQTLAFQPNTLYAPGKTSILGTEDFSSKAPNIIDIQTLQLDYHRPVWEGNLALGGKLSKVTTDNSFSLFNIVNELNVLDSARSSSFLYREKVNAGYISFEKKLEKIRFQLGLRAEHTDILGDLTRVAKHNTSDRAVDSGYVSLFPSANLNYQFNKNHTTQISYQRRIRRPNYQNLNPFEVRWSSDAFRWGNPFLKPQFSDKFEISHSYKSLQFSLAYTETRDFMSMITDTLDDNTVYLTWINLDSRKVANANVYYSFKPIKGKTWNVVTNASVSYAQNRLDLGPGKEVNLTYTAFTLFH
ncbi:MAG: TonB-dependent receptor, partial [Bacteroidetes bacterium]|nr:TonB-dependent receptor [Bacteroidota bacterium]